MNHPYPIARLAGALVAALLLCLLGSCITVPEGKARVQSIVRAVPGGDPPWQRDDGAPGVTVRRGGGEQPARVGMELERGDVLITRSGVAVVLRLPEGSRAAVDENTAVRLGSLEVIFGRLFADLRGLFLVRSEIVEAVNEGTRFLFEVGRDRSVRVVVADGALSCRSPSGAWPPVRVTEGRSLLSVYPGRGAPRMQPGDAREVDGPLRAIASAPRDGWCCREPGRPVARGFEGRCPGPWSVSRESAEAQCRPAPPPEPTVWCCVTAQRRLLETTRDRCEGLKGTPYANEATARQRCVLVN